MFPVLASYSIVLLFFSDSVKWWLEKKVLVIFMRLSSLVKDLAINTRSSAKKTALITVFCSSIPKPVEFSSAPKLLRKSAKSSGERLQPLEEKHKYFSFYIGINLPCFTPRVSHSSDVKWPLIKKLTESFVYIDLMRERVRPPNPRAESFANRPGLHTLS